jgi:hypothetical protein
MIVNKREDMVMNKIAKNTTLWGKWFVIFASLFLCVGMGATQALADVAVDSSNNNFTMIDPSGGLTGGTNDVTFTWDGTLKTSVAASGQVPNASILSAGPCPFFGVTWSAHDVAVYGPGTYTVYSDCPSGSPGCGTGSPVTFTVAAGELGVHMLFNYGPSTNIDVVDVWTRNAVFAPSPLWTGACAASNYSITNSAGTTYTAPAANIVWDLMSKDWNGDGFNGGGMVDGPFVGFNANFNMMATPDACGGCNDNNLCTVDKCNKTTLLCEYTTVSCDDTVQCTRDFCDPATGCQFEDHCTPPTEPTLITPADGSTGLGTTLELRWTKSTDPQNDLMTYHITYCKTPNAGGCVSVLDVKETNLVKRDSKDVFYAGGAGLLMIGMTFIGGITGRKKIIALLIIVVLFAGGAFVSCKNTKNADTTTPLAGNQVNTMVQGLDAGTTYYWRVEADNGYGKVTSSPSSTTAQSFTTR